MSNLPNYGDYHHSNRHNNTNHPSPSSPDNNNNRHRYNSASREYPSYHQQQRQSQYNNTSAANHYQQYNSLPNRMPPPPQQGAPRPMNGHHHQPPITNNPYYQRGSTINRSKSLTRPERQRPRPGLINAHGANAPQRHPSLGPHRRRSHLTGNTPERHSSYNQPMSNNLQMQLAQQKQQMNAAEPVQSQDSTLDDKEDEEKEPSVLNNWWAWIAFICTCCFPSYIIRVWFGKSNKSMQQAWREKVTLCYLVGFLCGLLAYVIYGLNIDLCPKDRQTYPYSAINSAGERVPIQRTDVYVFGQLYEFNTMKSYFDTLNLNLTKDFQGMELGSIFDGDTDHACAIFKTGDIDPTLPSCSITSPSGKTTIKQANGSCIPLSSLHAYSNNGNYLSFDWQDIHQSLQTMSSSNLGLIANTILNLTTYFAKDKPIFGKDVDLALRSTRGNDVTYALLYTEQGKQARRCIMARYGVGTASQEVASCVADNIIMTVMFAVIIIIIVIRYVVALLFQWFISRGLVKPGGRSNWLAWRSIKGGNDDPANHIPGPYNNYPTANGSIHSFNSIGLNGQQSPLSVQSSNQGLSGRRTDIVETELYTVMLVTCYSEGEQGLRTTMDSLSNTTYSNKHKIFFVIADGLITGAGESMSTPDIVVNMMDLTPAMANPKPCSYLAVADGEKQLNMAKVYAGHYNGTPCITIVKCGTEEEQEGPKPGNRGKRDSQVILMTFFQRVLFNDRLCELDYEIFWKMTWLMKGVTPDKFELVLMVDADTQVLPDALTYMVAAMANDITIMGLCGETRIANKRASWVSAIQVFEYYISHHYTKAFESLFGMVTCLPGCFSMYRIKSPKNGSWVPILANPDIILEYNQNVVTTLHEKNLLLLGEDRFLSTLMLRTFPKRQMMFVPQARCRTVVPDEFSVLLSQRRRWINSTVHNLMELVLVSDLCGISFLSMQFSVFIDLIGTFVLPAAIVMSVYLIVEVAITPNPPWQSLGLLVAILVLPAILISITTFKFVYIMWMAVYICALPIWNMVLPLYSFWHFDDFSWGATRVVVGEKKGDAHGGADGKFDSKRLVMKKWENWEAERTGQRQSRKFPLKTPQSSFSAFDGNSPKQSVSSFFK
ncbi:MAG: chitin synthase [Benjaminiella poitrasii]|nr:MAG: chitin synthase [Benjaminiella poitrasii]